MNWLIGLTIGSVLCGAVGCGTDPSGTGGGGTGGSGGASSCDDPVNGPVPENCGIWVSVSQGSDANPGTRGAPVASLTHAVELAKGDKEHVYACAETWTDPLVLPGNMGLHGGFDCDNGWAYLGKQKRSILATAPDEIALIVSDDGSGGKATVTDFDIEAADAAKPSGSSIAVLVRDTVPLWLYRCDLLAGNGADGLDGTPADPDDKPAPDGPPGNAGADACSAAVSEGGSSPEASCEAGGTSKGGVGGDGSPAIASNGTAGEPATGDPEDGAGGLGEANAPVCTDGKTGAVGVMGEHGLGGHGFVGYEGRLTTDGYLGTAGIDGQPGAPGQGGGGGGATFGSVAVCGAATPGGAAGGSGGSGGCGGKGGGGGQPGGASIAIGLRNKLAYFQTRLLAGKGGKGGNGAPGQVGGAGGNGGLGGGGSGTIKPGCAGGTGGSAGKGGWGGGGQGGPSMAVALAGIEDNNWQIDTDQTSELHNADQGLGGLGDPMHFSDSNGWPGTAAAVGLLNP